MEVTESANRRGGSELDASVAVVLKSGSGERSSVEEPREGAGEAASKIEERCGGS
jgi:hypothetical protein